MAKSNKRYNAVYPKENEGRDRDTNKKLKGQIKSLNKRIRELESENKTLRRSFSKSCQMIGETLEDKPLEKVLEMVRDYEYKETERGRQNEKEKVELRENNEEFQDFKDAYCPKCGTKEKDGYTVLNFRSFELHTCTCGFRTRKNKGEGIERG